MKVKPKEEDMQEQIDKANARADIYLSVAHRAIHGMAGLVRDGFLEGHMIGKLGSAGSGFDSFDSSEVFGRMQGFIKELVANDVPKNREEEDESDTTSETAEKQEVAEPAE
jgi:hypothetical protein